MREDALPRRAVARLVQGMLKRLCESRRSLIGGRIFICTGLPGAAPCSSAHKLRSKHGQPNLMLVRSIHSRRFVMWHVLCFRSGLMLAARLATLS